MAITEVSNIQFSSPKIPTFTSPRSEVNPEAVGRRRPKIQGVALPAVLSLLLHPTVRDERFRGSRRLSELVRLGTPLLLRSVDLYGDRGHDEFGWNGAILRVLNQRPSLP